MMQINRLFEIVYILLDQKCVTAAELSERFEVSVRTIYRDIETLSSAGIPVYMRKGKGGGISLLPGFTLNKTVLTASERENIVSSLRATQHLTKEQDSSALNKLGSLFGEMNTDWLEVDFSNWGDNGKEMDAFNRLKPAIIHRRVVRFSYASNKEEKTTRTVLPLKLVFKGQAWYLYGYCRLRKDYRFFKLRRIDELTVSDESFCMKIPENVLAESVNYQKEAITGKIIRLKLRIAPEMGYRVLDEFETYTVDQEGYYICALSMPEGEWLFSFLASFAGRCQILEPEWFKDKMREKIRNWLQEFEKN